MKEQNERIIEFESRQIRLEHAVVEASHERVSFINRLLAMLANNTNNPRTPSNHASQPPNQHTLLCKPKSDDSGRASLIPRGH